jgi:hypothetical protein
MLFVHAMADQRALDALARIERAFDRIEAAAARPAAAPPPVDQAPEYRRLREAHETLRSRVTGAIGEIDRLLEAGGTR